ncbi:Helitron_like_N domain-containing protein [Azospirillaceae bacterium]
MNLFVTSPDPIACAQALDDRRLIKGVLETAQLLSTAGYGPYKTTHINHPVTKWVCRSLVHIAWTQQHFNALAQEYTFRFGKIHKTAVATAEFAKQSGKTPVPFENEPQEFQNSARNATLGLDFTNRPVFQAYRDYLNTKWRLDGAKARWTQRGAPEWFHEQHNGVLPPS